MDKVERLSTLRRAWAQVKARRGAAGVDGVSIKRFERHSERYLKELEAQLVAGTYRPRAVKRVEIPKGHGRKRPLGIPVVADRIVQTAIKLTIEPIFEAQFRDASYGFRPGRGCKDACGPSMDTSRRAPPGWWMPTWKATSTPSRTRRCWQKSESRLATGACSR
jgi:RNA-directed DNA polymerase